MTPTFPPSKPLPLPRQPIRASGGVVRVLQERLVAVQLPNGYVTLAHWPPGHHAPPPFAPGMLLELEFSPYDMTQVRILPQDH